MVWHQCTQQMAANGKGTQLTPCEIRVPRPSKLSDLHFLQMEFPQFGHCRGITPIRVFQTATKPPRILVNSKCGPDQFSLSVNIPTKRKITIFHYNTVNIDNCTDSTLHNVSTADIISEVFE